MEKIGILGCGGSCDIGFEECVGVVVVLLVGFYLEY